MYCLCNITSYLQPAQAVDMLHTNLAFDRTNDVAFLGVYNAPAYVSLRPLRCPSSHSLQPSGKSTTRICQSLFWIMPTICDVVLHSSTVINFQLSRINRASKLRMILPSIFPLSISFRIINMFCL